MKSPFKVAVVAACPFPYPRGTPIRILRMAEGLAARGHEVHAFTYHLGQKIEELPFTIHRIPNIPTYQKLSPGPTYQKVFLLDPLLTLKIYLTLRKEKFDIIHAHHFEGFLAALPVARLLNIPIVFDAHTLLSSELPHYPLGLSKWIMMRIGNTIDQWLPRQADHIVSVSNIIRDKIINEVNIDPQHVTTVYGGIEADHFSLQDASRSKSISETLIYTGNLAPYQGIDLMFRAFRKALNQHPGLILKLVTNSPIDSYSEMIKELEIGNNLVVEGTNYFKLPSQLHSAAIALNPRVDCDGTPLKLLNYMATGRGIIAFQGSAEILDHEQTGLVVPNNDIDAFAAAIIRLLDDKQLILRLGSNAQKYIYEFFVWERSIEILEMIYKRLTAP